MPAGQPIIGNKSKDQITIARHGIHVMGVDIPGVVELMKQTVPEYQPSEGL